MRTLALLAMFASRLSWWMGSLISILRCLPRLPLPRCWAGPRASQWIAQLYSLCFQGVCFAMLRFQGFFVVFGCLLRCCFGLRFQMAGVGMLAALSTLWSFCLGLRC